MNKSDFSEIHQLIQHTTTSWRWQPQISHSLVTCRITLQDNMNPCRQHLLWCCCSQRGERKQTAEIKIKRSRWRPRGERGTQKRWGDNGYGVRLQEWQGGQEVWGGWLKHGGGGGGTRSTGWEQRLWRRGDNQMRRGWVEGRGEEEIIKLVSLSLSGFFDEWKWSIFF